jgi:hypothetical protein
MPNARSGHGALLKVQAMLLAASLLSSVSLLAKEKNYAPLPAQVMIAKTVYIDNQSEEAALVTRRARKLESGAGFSSFLTVRKRT